ncbi:Ca2+-binding EF-hand superfamily protein [Methylobacterium sp. PvP062]|uniref:Ca2+-binding EF-hand superfamily protein n=1 Tax=Methylobacterium radiotolerans TaxID=31998 RepID=A0ABV2NN45_9HYPH|nr:MULTISPECIES: phage tail length tape measure family protein [unclassified Methylobacterium]MBP2495379.1 Ca2+-binding EF-hand superfamily protein [Methylobacterium sp. PvP105]MBP2504750.1 Ca2+-binding EF-hand superfamily protein [Methylobacterium sp. PvP109]MCX7335760.1 phage tail length tape measure family protein [Hyphomicrobiales bacterium]
MADLDTIQEIRIVASTEGVNETIAAANRLGTSLDKLATTNDNLAASEAQVAVAGDRTTKYRISAAAAADRLQRSLDAEYRAQKQMEAALKDIERARSQGIISATREGELLKLAQDRYSGVAVAMNRASAANTNHAASSGIAAHQLQNLGYQLNDVATSLASGAPLFQVFAQQAGQIGQVLGEAGVMATIRGVGGVIARFLTPAVVSIGALTGAVVLGYMAWSRYDDDSRKVSVTLQGLGRETGLTQDAFEKLAASAAAAGNISVRQASALGATLAATGRIGPENIGKLIAVSKDLAATFGTDLDGIKDKLTAFGTVEGISRLNDQLQFLDARTLRVIQSLFQAGKEQDAIRLAVERLPAALAKSETAQGAVARAWEAIKNGASDADNAVGRFIDRLTKGPSPADRLKELQDRVEALKAADAENLVQPGGTRRAYVPPTSPTVASTTAVPIPPSRPTELQSAQSELQKYMEKLAATKREELEVAERKELEASLNRKSNELKKLTEEAGLGSDSWRKYKDFQIAADEALKSGNPELMKRVDNVKDLAEAGSILEHVVKTTSNAEGERLTAGDKAAEQRRIDIASTRAVTVEERARAAQMQVEARQRGQLITVQQAQADAEHAAQMVREQSDAQLRQMLRDQGLEADGIRKRIDLIGQGAEAQAVAVARQRAEQDLTRQGISLNGSLAQSVIAGAEANARLSVSYDKAAEAQQRMRDGQRELASEFTGFITDILAGGQKIGQAFDTVAKNLSANSLRAVISGEGPLAGLLGTASTEKGQLGGLLGGSLNLNKLFDVDKITETLGIGAESGIGKALSTALKPSRSGGGILSSPLGGALTSAGAGASIGYSSQSPLVGAAGGALAGYMVGGPIGALVGGGAGLLGGLFGESQAKKQAKKQLQQELQARREALDQARPQIEQLALTFEGGSIGNIGKQISDALTQAKQAIKTASDGGDQALADRLMKGYQTYVARVTAVFSEGFNGVAAEMQAGFGTGGPFSQAIASVQQLGETIKGFVADAGRLSPAAVAAAQAAAVTGALAALQPPPNLSATQTELARINGTATGLNQVLKDLGLSAEEAADAIRNGTNKALDQLRTKFTDDLGRKINDALNKGYLNDAADLVKEVASLQEDASAIGGDLGQVDTYFTAAAQKIVDGSQLAGGAFDELIAKFPQLAGRVREYSETASMSADQAAKAAQEALSAIQDRMRGYEDRYVAATFETESLPGKLLAFDRAAEWERWQEGAKGNQAINELEQAQGAERLKIITDFAKAATEALNTRLRGYADRLFAATNDTSTLGGQLAAYDRQAQQERQDEVKAGGQALAQLEQTQYAERLKIITDFQKQATEAAKQQLAAAQTAFETFVKNIKTYLDNLRSGASTPLSPKDRLAAAQSQYDAQLALAKGGDRTALDSITQYSDALLEASKAYNASGAAYQATFQKILTDLQALPTQVSAEQFIVDAINDSKEAIVSATEAMRAALQAGLQANSPALIATALLQNFQMLDTSVNGLLDQGEFLAGLGPLATSDEQRQAKQIFNAIDTNGDGQLSRLELQNASSYRVEQYTAATNSNVDTNNNIANAQKSTMDYQSGILNNQNAILNNVNALNNAQLGTQQQLVNLNSSMNGQNSFIQQNTGFTNDVLVRTYGTLAGTYDLTTSMLNNLRSANAKNGAGVFATGGWVNGPGTGTSDSISARLSNGEFVVNAASARLYGPMLEAINDNAGVSMPAVAMPVPVRAGRDDSALIAEVRALRASNERLEKRVAVLTEVAEAGHLQTIGAVKQTTAAVQDGNANESRRSLAKKVA